jgi:hypothetical protein
MTRRNNADPAITARRRPAISQASQDGTAEVS